MRAEFTILVDREARMGMNRQIADQLLILISSGHFKPSARLPGEVALAEKLDVSRDVVRRAYQILSDSGHIESKSTRGWFVVA